MATVSAPNPLLAAASTKPSGSDATPALSNAAQQQQTQFLNLLVTQLKEQNPLDPQDGTQFVTQLAQFSSLEELVNIRTILQGSLRHRLLIRAVPTRVRFKPYLLIQLKEHKE
jgi:flagellar basal-body rod modification protein FlgD